MKIVFMHGKLSVIGKGFEPLTHSLEGCCSIQLSYPTSPYLFFQRVQKYIFLLFLQNIRCLKSPFFTIRGRY